jgi:hypothetical protein
MAFMLRLLAFATVAVFVNLHGTEAAVASAGTCNVVQGKPVSRLIAPPSDKVPYGELSLDWWRWAFTGLQNLTFQEKKKCTGDQKYELPDHTPVFFLAGVEVPVNDTGGLDVVRSVNCVAPKGAYFMIPVVNSASALSTNESEVEILPNGDTTRNSTEWLLATDITKTCASFSLAVDGKVIANKGYYTLSPFEPFEAPPIIVNTIGGQSLGSWVVLRPLAPGKHTIKACTVLKRTRGVFRFCVTYKLTVKSY